MSNENELIKNDMMLLNVISEKINNSSSAQNVPFILWSISGNDLQIISWKYILSFQSAEFASIVFWSIYIIMTLYKVDGILVNIITVRKQLLKYLNVLLLHTVTRYQQKNGVLRSITGMAGYVSLTWIFPRRKVTDLNFQNIAT